MRRARTSVWLVGALVLLLGGCDALSTGDKTPDRVEDGTAELDLTVTGRPTPGSLATTEHVLARLKARDADGLAALAGKGDGTREDAKRWVDRWGDAAQNPVRATSRPPEKGTSVDLRFTGERSALTVLLGPENEDAPYDDTFTVVLREGREGQEEG
ncbi:hypothetical protein ACOZE3_03040 [Streptomyces cinereoruber]|uniref:hypothetical protein n=1 Tax=Streptomyces cinereoruber TaxID=67260 RepID=UPI003BF552E1